MKIIAIADLQGLCKQVTPDMLPGGDMLLIAGDLAGWGTKQELEEVNEWLGTLDYEHKVIVAGNHDQYLSNTYGQSLFTNATYLENETVEIEGIKIYGSPMNEMNELRFSYVWGFCDPAYIEEAAHLIPKDIDILLTHGPAYGFLDKLKDGRSVGSKVLRDAIIAKKPKYHIFGHIHESHGIEQFNDTTFVNAAICSERNQMLKDGKLFFEPIVIEI